MKAVVADHHTRVLCLRIAPLAANPIYLTHYPRDLRMEGGNTYLSASGYDFTAYSSGSDFAAGVIDLEGIAGLAGVGYDQIASGVFDNARAYLFATSWAAPIEDEEPIVCSILGKTTTMDDRYKIEEMALIDILNQSVGKSYTVSCPKRFGGQEFAGCKVDLGPITVTSTLTAVSANNLFQDSARSEPADYFGVGTIRFTTGANADLKPLEIKAYAADGTIETYEPFHYAPQVGDQYIMIPGCRKRQDEDCIAKWDNIVNFGGFKNVLTQSQYVKIGGTRHATAEPKLRPLPIFT